MEDMSSKLVLVGGGGHCKSVLDTALRMACFKEIVITDYYNPEGSSLLGCKVVGTDEVLPDLYKNGYRSAFITVGSIKSTDVRRNIFEKCKKIGFQSPNIIDSSALISNSVDMGIGVFVGKNAILNADSIIGNYAIINTACIIEHECKIGDFSHIAVGATVCGGVEIDSNVFIGANSTIIQGVKIGRNSVIGAGSIILTDVPENSTIVGAYR
jgi:sugar O-acyltransferase (sialic acid O-acetyltransferase NeuD family)